MECVAHIQQITKKGIFFIKKNIRTLMNLNLGMDEEYLQHQEEKTVRDHKRDIIPNCIISYCNFFFFFGLVMHSIFHAGNYWMLSKY